tara:strand:+ start:128 stop:1204 length:1077 start_codon:yes stop_codon:yes gene_type:complete
MDQKKTAFITFFPINTNNMGSSTVINSRYKSWPQKKKIFQLSHINCFKSRDIETIYIKKETPFNKLINLHRIINSAYKFLRKGKSNILVIEGASWIFYSFCTLMFFKLFLPSTKIIYISHSIEYEIRKKYSNFFIYGLTFLLEYIVLHSANISTSVSKIEKKRIYNLYKKKTHIFPNGINIKKNFSKRILKNNYIIFIGSYSYKPNKNAINYLNNILMPEILKEFPDLKLVLTGGGYKRKFPWLINKGIVTKKTLYNLISYASCMCVPLEFGSGTRIKIIEALILGCVVLSTKKGIEGIDILKTNPPFIIDKKNMVNKLVFILKNKKKLKSKSNNAKKYYLNLYSMKNITEKFIRNFI